MKKIEVSGRTIEEAVQLAAQELGVTTEALEYEIMEEGSKGFLGLGQTPTLITAWVKEGYTPQAEPIQQPTPTYEEKTEEYVAPEGAYEGAESFTEALMSILNDVLKAMSLDAKPVIKSDTDDEIEVEIAGTDVAILIGKQGQTLDALQYLVSIAASKAVPSSKRVILDAGSYREHHRQALEKLAREYADAVKEHAQEAVIEPQSARDRRIIHMALADDPDVYTYSEGFGDDRHIVISPKK